MEKQDRRRKYPEGEKLVRFTISMSETQYKEVLEAAGDSSVSKYIRDSLGNLGQKD
jgi:hypothetical protein